MLKLFFASTLAFVLCAARAAVLELTPTNFDDIIDGSKPALVEFYAPWCGHCKNLAPEYEKVGSTFDSERDGVIVAKVDAATHTELGQKFGVSGFPTLKWFSKGSTDPDDYSGGRTAADMAEFINEKTGLTNAVKEAPTAVTLLSDTSFNNIVKDPKKGVLVEFYAPWCGHCKALKPTYEKLASAFEAEKNVVIAAIDAAKYRDLASEYDVSGFPTLKYFPAGSDKTPEDYSGGRTLTDLVTFINEKSGTFRTEDGSLTSEAGVIPELSHLVKKYMGSQDENLVKEAKEKASKLSGDAVRQAKYYIKVMEKIAAKGTNFVEKETARLGRMLAGEGVSAAKRTNMMLRRNVLNSLNE